jgi:hypothetical protein
MAPFGRFRRSELSDHCNKETEIPTVNFGSPTASEKSLYPLWHKLHRNDRPAMLNHSTRSLMPAHGGFHRAATG